MKVKLKLTKKFQKKVAWDPDTDITWTRNKVFETEITPFIAKAMAKGVLEEIKGKETAEK